MKKISKKTPSSKTKAAKDKASVSSAVEVKKSVGKVIKKASEGEGLLRDLIGEFELEELCEEPVSRLLYDRLRPSLGYNYAYTMIDIHNLSLNMLLDTVYKKANNSNDNKMLCWTVIHNYLWSLIRNYRFEMLDLDRGLSLTLTPHMSRLDLEEWAASRHISDWLSMGAEQLLGPYDYIGSYPASYYSIADLITDHPSWSLLHLKQLISRYHDRTINFLLDLAPRANQPKLPILQGDVSEDMHDFYGRLIFHYGRCAHYQSVLNISSDIWKNVSVEINNDDYKFIYRSSIKSKYLYNKSNSLSYSYIFIARDNMIYIHNTMISSHCSYYSLVDAEACFAVAQFLTHPDAQKARQTIVHHWATPQWQRELDRILTNDPKDDEPLLRDGEWLGWLVEDEGHWWTYKALPIAVRNKKTGKGITSRKISANLLRKKSLDLDSKERELAMIWLAFNSKESRNYTDPESLAKLIQIAHAYKSLYIKSASSIELAQITNHQITVELHDDPPSLQLALNHQPLDKKLAEIVTSLQGPDFIIQRGLGSQLQIIEIPAPVIRLVQRARSTSLTLHKNATPFFKEKKQELSQKPGVSLAPSLRGTHVPPQRHLVAKLQPLPQGGLSLSILAQPLPGAPSVTPGQPPSTLHAITDHDDLYTERDLDAELLHVQQLTEQLHLTDRLDADLSLSLDSPDDAAELLEPLKLYASQPNSDLSLQWTSQRPISYSRNSSSSQLKLAIKPVERFFKVTGALHIDEHSSIPLEQLLLAARENKKWIQLNEETWVEIEASLNKHLQQLAHSINTKKSTLDPLAATSLIQLQEHGAQLKADTKWLTHVKKIQDAQKLEPKTPKSLKATLRSYQLDGYQWLARLATWAPGAILADDMGLGKTVQALTLLLSRSKQGPQLVIAPASVCTNWSREAATFAPSLNVHLIRSGAQLEDSPIPAPNDLFILGYDLLARHVESFKDVTWQTAVFDEAQAFKNSDTQRFAAIQALNADFRLALTGTPVENHTGELWSIVSSTVTGLLGKESHFTKTFRAPIERDQSASAQHALAQLISPFVLRRLKRDVAQELPPRTDIRLDIELSADERRRYETFRRATIATLEDTNQNNEAPEQNKRFAILAALTRLRQLANHVRLVEPKSKIESSKLNILREHLLELKEQGHRALVFSQFVSLLELVRDDLTSAGLDVVMLDGSMTQKKRQLAVDAFQDNQHDVFLLSIKAGGVGLNLTAANFVFILDPWWNPAVEDQATDRAHRIGQDQPVTVYRLIAQDTVEEIIYTMHQQKRELMDSLLSESGSSRALSLEELSSLINHSSSPD